jgi:hypothetical protein
MGANAFTQPLAAHRRDFGALRYSAPSQVQLEQPALGARARQTSTSSGLKKPHQEDCQNFAASTSWAVNAQSPASLPTWWGVWLSSKREQMIEVPQRSLDDTHTGRDAAFWFPELLATTRQLALVPFRRGPEAGA